MKMEGSMKSVLDCVLPYIHDGDDLISISLVSRKFYELDRITRKHITVHLFYASNPSTLSNRFPFIESLTLKGLPNWDPSPQLPNIDITPWIKEISVKFEFLKALYIRRMLVSDEHLELLAKTRGRDLRTLKICECEGFSNNGLLHISEYCNGLTTLCLKNNIVLGKVHDVEDLTIVAQKCSNSLVTLKITPTPLNHLRDAFCHSKKLRDFDGGIFVKGGDYTSFKFPPSIRGLGIRDLPVTSYSFLLPYVSQLRELDLKCTKFEHYCQCFLIERCPNLEVLSTNDVCGDMGLRVIGQVCKKLRKLIHLGRVTHMGLIALVQGCTNLEFLDVSLSNISNEAIEYVGTHLKNLGDFSMALSKKAGNSITDLPLDNGIRAMLKGCIKLKRLTLSLCDEELTDVGLGYIEELSKGCQKLRKLYLWDCPFSKQAVATFVFNIHSLRYVWVENGHHTDLALTRPMFTAHSVQK
nr:hypothetical protein [Tanacetum cinerariifolium]